MLFPEFLLMVPKEYQTENAEKEITLPFLP